MDSQSTAYQLERLENHPPSRLVGALADGIYRTRTKRELLWPGISPRSVVVSPMAFAVRWFETKRHSSLLQSASQLDDSLGPIATSRTAAFG